MGLFDKIKNIYKPKEEKNDNKKQEKPTPKSDSENDNNLTVNDEKDTSFKKMYPFAIELSRNLGQN